MPEATKKNLIIYWQDGPSNGYADLIPRFWFDDEGPQERVDHYVLSRANKQSKARCSLNIEDDIAVLDYEKHKTFNEGNGSYAGSTKIVFTDNTRTEVAAVYWRDKGKREFWLRPVLIDPLENDVEASEGDPRLVIHTRRERSRALRQEKIADALKNKGNLNCEACGFSFEKRYGDIGRDFCEVHHREGLAETGRTTTRPQDLAILCSNCHRMIHKTEYSVQDFAEYLAKVAEDPSD